MSWDYWNAGISGMNAMAHFMSAMMGGMAIMVVPSLAVCVMITRMAWRRRDTYTND